MVWVTRIYGQGGTQSQNFIPTLGYKIAEWIANMRKVSRLAVFDILRKAKLVMNLFVLEKLNTQMKWRMNPKAALKCMQKLNQQAY